MEMPDVATNIKYYGRGEPLPLQRRLNAGPLSMVLEDGDLRYIRLGDREVLRRVYVAVRDANWRTIQPSYSNVRLDIAPDAFDIAFDAEHVAGEIDFAWHGTLRGHADGTITYIMDGEARRTFRKNRIGFCVLHPMECGGVPCTVRHVDGSLEHGAFPVQIAPHQPFMDVEAITHDVLPGVRAEVRLAGDVFEMEDQRNWTDASFKTYSTPLRLPFPVEVQQGTTISQSFTLSLHGPIPDVAAQDGGPVMVTIDHTTARPLPRLGLGVASHGRPLSATEVARLQALRPAHLRVDLDLGSPTYEAVLLEATRQGRALGVPLEIALFLSDNAPRELAGLGGTLLRQKPAVARWLIFHKGEDVTSAQWLRLARDALTGYEPRVAVGAGTNVYFTELNRNRPTLDVLDLVSYAVTPQVHAFDNASLVETLAAQAVTLDSARRFCGDTPLAVSPVTLKPRFNPVATGPEPEPGPGELPPQVDVRQMSLFGAGWTAGSIKYLAAGGAASATYYETTGWRGIMETEAGSPLPERFPSVPGMLFPLYHVLADVGEFAGAMVLATAASHPLQVDGLALRAGPRLRVLLANMTAEPRDVCVQDLGVDRVQVRLLDERSFDRATRDGDAWRAEAGEAHVTDGGSLQLHLLPYAVVRLEGRV